MILENKLNITHQVELAKAEEKISKQKAKQLFDTSDIEKAETGTFTGLSYIHTYLFEEIYEFAGKLREVNIAKGDFRFAPVIYLALLFINIFPRRIFKAFIRPLVLLRRISNNLFYAGIYACYGGYFIV